MKEEISVYFRMALGRGVAGKERPRMDGKRKTPASWAVAAREGRSILPEKNGNDLNCLYPGVLTRGRLGLHVRKLNFLALRALGGLRVSGDWWEYP